MKTKTTTWIICFLLLFSGRALAQPNQPGSGNCLEYDGVNDYVNVPDANSLDISNAITIEAWINMDVLPTPTNLNWPIVCKRRTTGTGLSHDYINYTLKVKYFSNAVRLVFVYRDGSGTANNYVSAPLALNTNRWYHAAVSYTYGNGASVRMFLDGADITAGGWWVPGNGNTPVSVNNYPVQIGRVHYSGGTGPTWFSNGQIDEVRIWNYARSQTEIREDMCRKLQGNEPGLVGYWRFDEGSGTTAFDSSPNGNDGTLQ